MGGHCEDAAPGQMGRGRGTRGAEAGSLNRRAVALGEDIMARQQWAVGAGLLLGLLVLVVAGCSGKPEPEKNEQPAVKDEQSAVKAIKKLGGRIRVDPERPGNPVVSVYFFPSTVTDAYLKELKGLKKLEVQNVA